MESQAIFGDGGVFKENVLNILPRGALEHLHCLDDYSEYTLDYLD